MYKYVLLVYIHPHMNKMSYYWKLIKNFIFIVDPASAWDNDPCDSGSCFCGLILCPTRHFIWNLYYTPHDTSNIYTPI